MKKRTTFEELVIFWNTAQAWLVKDEKNGKTKLAYAIRKMEKQVTKAQQRYQNAVEDLNIDHCEVDDKGVIRREPTTQDYMFTKQGLKTRNKERQNLFESVVEIEPYFATLVPDDLTDFERETMTGFVLKEEAEAAAASEAVAGD